VSLAALKKPFLSVSLAFKYAPGQSLLHLVQCVVAAVLAPVSIFAAQRVIDITVSFAGKTGDLSRLPVWGALWIGALFLADAHSGFINWIIIASVKRRFLQGISLDIAKKFLRLSYPCFEDTATRDLLQRMSASPEEKLFLLFRSSVAFLQIVISISGTALILSQAGIGFSVAFMALFVPIAWFTYKGTDMMRTMMARQSSEERRMTYFGSLLSGKAPLFELKVFRAVSYIAEKWRASAKKVVDERVRTTVRAQMLFLAHIALQIAWITFIVFWLVVSLVRGSVSLGFFTAVIAALFSIFEHVGNAANTYQMIRFNSLAVENYRAFLELEEWGTLPDTAPSGPGSPGGIVFWDVHFTYPGTDRRSCAGSVLKYGAGNGRPLSGKTAPVSQQ
jgi:ATP-binding cassette subfamily B protein